MIHILLTILKIVGILLASVFGLILLLALVVLFWPINYRITGEWMEENKNFQVRVTWFCRIVSLRFLYPSEEGLIIKIFGKRINLDKEPGVKGKTKKSKTPKTMKTITPNESTVEESGTDAVDKEVVVEETKPKKENFLLRIKNKIKQIWFKIKNVYAKINKIKSILEKEETKLFLSDSMGRIKKIWKRIKPKVLKVNGTFGLGTPDLTGEVYGLYWAIKPHLSKDFILIPDFDNLVFTGNYYIKGRITVFVFLLNGCKIYFDKRFKSMLNQWNADERGVDNNGKEQSV